jgi:ferredoxin
MSHSITADECTSCGACGEVRPEQAISEVDNAYMIDQALCTDCAVCMEACPVAAIIPPGDILEE